MPKSKPQYNLATAVEVLRQHQRVITNLARDAAEAGDLQSFLDVAVQRIAAAIEIDHVKVLRYRPEQDDLFVEAGVGWKAGVVKVASLGSGLSSPPGRAFQTGQPVMIEDLSQATEYKFSAMLREHEIVSLLNVPIFIDSAVWGVLEADSSILRGFDEDTCAFMIAAAAQIALVIRRTEAEAAHAQAVANLAQEARRRELLLREMQHRVKNNFQTILAMIAIRKPKFPQEEGRRLVSQIEDGIVAMALAHGQLSPTQLREEVELSSYIRALTQNVGRTVEHIGFDLHLDRLEVSIEQAVPLGLIINEAITNAVKHAFGPESGVITIELNATKDEKATLKISDNGKGITEPAADGSGRKLIRALTDQVRGRSELTSSPSGTTLEVRFFPRHAALPV